MAESARSKYELNVFINCPFDRRYVPLFRGIVFAVHDCGFIARCAQEISNTALVRVSKILSLIAECRIGIHDLSRTESSGRPRLPRFNMPLELGMFLGAREYGSGQQRQKSCLVLDKESFRYQRFCSDIAGQDISSHDGNVPTAIGKVRDFLRAQRKSLQIPGSARIYQRYTDFTVALPALLRRAGLTKAEMTFVDYAGFVEEWLKLNPKP